MTGLIGGRWTAGNRLEPSRPNGRGRILRLVPSSVVGRQRGGPRPREERVRQGATLLRAGRTLGRDAYTRRTVAQCRARGRPARSGLTRGHGASFRVLRRPVCRGWGVPVAESVLAPPGPIPNPVVTQCSAGEYCGGDPVGGEAAAGAARLCPPSPSCPCRGVEQRQLVGLITQRSRVRIPPPLPHSPALPSRGFCCLTTAHASQ